MNTPAEIERLLDEMIEADRRYCATNDEGLSEEVLGKLHQELRAAQDAFARATGRDMDASHE